MAYYLLMKEWHRFYQVKNGDILMKTIKLKSILNLTMLLFLIQNGLALIVQDDKGGYINKQGKIEINPQFEMASDFYWRYCVGGKC